MPVPGEQHVTNDFSGLAVTLPPSTLSGQVFLRPSAEDNSKMVSSVLIGFI